jgi:hypothetical protein
MFDYKIIIQNMELYLNIKIEVSFLKIATGIRFF